MFGVIFYFYFYSEANFIFENPFFTANHAMQMWRD